MFWTFAHDTIGPRLQDAAPADSVTFRMTFSSQINPYLPLDTARVRLFALPDTTAVPVRAIWTTTVFDSLQTRERAIADSLKRAKDTTARGAVKRDSTPARAQWRVPAPGPGCRRRAARRASTPPTCASCSAPGRYPPTVGSSARAPCSSPARNTSCGSAP